MRFEAFPSTVLMPGEAYDSAVEYRLSVRHGRQGLDGAA